MKSLRIRPFFAVYPPTSDAPKVASPPYDVVNREEAAEFAEGNEDSFMRVVRSEIGLPIECSPYDDRVYEEANQNYSNNSKEGYYSKESYIGSQNNSK